MGRPQKEDGYSSPQARFQATHTTRIVMNLNHNTDADILRKLETVSSKQGYIKNLIREDLRKDSHS